LACSASSPVAGQRSLQASSSYHSSVVKVLPALTGQPLPVKRQTLPMSSLDTGIVRPTNLLDPGL